MLGTTDVARTIYDECVKFHDLILFSNPIILPPPFTMNLIESILTVQYNPTSGSSRHSEDATSIDTGVITLQFGTGSEISIRRNTEMPSNKIYAIADQLDNSLRLAVSDTDWLMRNMQCYWDTDEEGMVLDIVPYVDWDRSFGDWMLHTTCEFKAVIREHRARVREEQQRQIEGIPGLLERLSRIVALASLLDNDKVVDTYNTVLTMVHEGKAAEYYDSFISLVCKLVRLCLDTLYGRTAYHKALPILSYTDPQLRRFCLGRVDLLTDILDNLLNNIVAQKQ